jgi:ectoine hydroxylase-related dioxygenase (phytanoyl-CoA dioxygenase family)
VNISQLQDKVVCQEQELEKTRQQLAQASHDPATFTTELAQSRAYAFDPTTRPVEEVVEGCTNSLSRYGFCVIENVIPTYEVPAICQEILEAQAKVGRNIRAIRELVDSEGLNDQELLASDKVSLRPVRRVGRPPKPPNDIVWMPKYARHLANPVVTAVARQVLDDHLRIAQLHPRIIAASSSDGTPGGFGSVHHRGRADTREWHTDWPHDLSAYGSDNPNENVGCIRQPFPDITMCLVMIWYLTDVDENSGGTWVVPGSHKDKRNPRGPSDEITVSAPIPGDMQVTATAGSVYIQDSRSWHASAMHNPSGQERVAVVNRWCPWWLSVDDYAPGSRYNMVCRPISHTEYLALPTELQPLMRHLCLDEPDAIQQPVLDRAKAASLRTRWGFRQLEENSDSLTQANAHIRVPVLPSEH